MKDILARIKTLPAGTEKDFFLDAVAKFKKYKKENDKARLIHLIDRLNGLYDGLSLVGRSVSEQMIQRIMEVTRSE